MRLILPLFALLFLAGCAPAVSNFQECVDAGYPVLESYPRQCVARGVTYVEELDEEVPMWSIQEILDIAQESECTEKGNLTDRYVFNGVTRTWWIDMVMFPEFENEMCSPACVVSDTNLSAEINWRCTGLIE